MRLNLEHCERLHNRNINITTYAYDSDAIALEGRLIDDRTNTSHNMFGDPRAPGTIHDMIVRMIIRLPKLVIEDLEVKMVTVPYRDCPEALKSLLPLKGERISAGFTAKVHRMAGGAQGCAHLVALCRAMASAAIQGAYSFASRRPPAKGQYSERSLKTVIDTCHIWRSDGPLVARLRKMMSAENDRL